MTRSSAPPSPGLAAAPVRPAAAGALLAILDPDTLEPEHPLLAAAFRALRRARAPAVADEEILAISKGLPADLALFVAGWPCIAATFEGVTLERLEAILEANTDPLLGVEWDKLDEGIGLLNLPLCGSWRRGKAEGRAEGRVEGEAEGRRAKAAGVVVRLLEHRCGRLEAALRTGIADARSGHLDVRPERALGAPRLDDVRAVLGPAG